VIPRLASLLVALLLLAGCGGSGSGGEQGDAQLWITRDRGATVLFEGKVPAGLTVMQALKQKADVDTRYGGRFVQAIDGLEGSLGAGRDWFFFVNGVSADRSAAEYRLHTGEVAWWDYRPWKGEREAVVVVGAFPEPFLHGYGGKRRETVVTYARPAQLEDATAIARVVQGRVVRGRVECCPNTFHLATGPPRFVASAPSAGGPYHFVFAGDAAALVRDPSRFRFRYEVAP
jgi:hypothetical protein